MANIRDLTEWRDRGLVDRGGEKIGKLEHVDIAIESDDFGTMKVGHFGRHQP